MRVAIVRHGKAEPDAPSGRDQDRPLAPRGYEQIQWLARTLLEEDQIPDLILASGHLRAMTTATILAESLQRPLHREPLLELGHSSGDIVGLLQLLSDGRWHGVPAPARTQPLRSLMLVGHNPQLERVVNVLLDGTTTNAARALRTGEAVLLDLPHAVPGAASLVDVLRLGSD